MSDTATDRPTEFSDLPREIQERIFAPTLMRLNQQILLGNQTSDRMRAELYDARTNTIHLEQQIRLIDPTFPEAIEAEDRLEDTLDDIDRLTRALNDNNRRTLQRVRRLGKLNDIVRQASLAT
jgi:hypothetical protein